MFHLHCVFISSSFLLHFVFVSSSFRLRLVFVSEKCLEDSFIRGKYDFERNEHEYQRRNRKRRKTWMVLKRPESVGELLLGRSLEIKHYNNSKVISSSAINMNRNGNYLQQPKNSRWKWTILFQNSLFLPGSHDYLNVLKNKNFWKS